MIVSAQLSSWLRARLTSVAKVPAASRELS
jgi:hypothetical protein